VRAFRDIPREHFLGEGPWLTYRERGRHILQKKVSDPRLLYDDIPVALIPERGLNNGIPSGLAEWLDELNLRPGHSVVHIGCSTGYYSAILAKVVGARGLVTALEVDHGLATRARQYLSDFRNVRIVEADGWTSRLPLADAIFVNAGANGPAETWLDSLSMVGRLIFPLITRLNTRFQVFNRRQPLGSATDTASSIGVMLKVVRRRHGYEACALSSVGIYPCLGGVNRKGDQTAARAIARGDCGEIRSLRRDHHRAESTCWMHVRNVCISRLPIAGS
jgi:protein-L-isoaspartate(D-aspartate) O-methyltransferase